MLSSVPAAAARAEGVYREIWRGIVEGDLEPGSRLKERDLSEQHDVSRIPVRQALQRLESEGFVVALPNRGARVAEVGRADIEELFDARLCIEPFAARRAAGRVRTEGQAVDDLSESLGRSIDSSDADVTGQATLDFHAEVVRLSGNSLLMRALAPMLGRMEWVFRLTPTTRESEHNEEHRRIFHAVAEGNVEAAGAHTHAHLELARESVMGALAVRLGW
ncbi:GntR family transcriptional regulator [Microbacterium sp. ASV49]|uniref:GntR family transcriptional regulator n=1 Tax=Microbacterium candidum TaxID=3041922 RepID=A0ABT7N1N6_9MICO|nr:GntR family transcriptional regulator [Microbacterium sp. ASV49]MDL9980581.1 GntR family transcriptional regulator [Microbacterium sp. ASV49]